MGAADPFDPAVGSVDPPDSVDRPDPAGAFGPRTSAGRSAGRVPPGSTAACRPVDTGSVRGVAASAAIRLSRVAARRAWRAALRWAGQQ
jgi:hypothetical protein